MPSRLTCVMIVLLCAVLPTAGSVQAQIGTFAREDMIRFTPEWKGERFPDGRPKVPDNILERMENVATEEAWSVLQRAGYRYQFEGNWQIVHPDRVLVGRAVTGTFIPHRPDVHDVTQEIGESQGRASAGGQNSWVIDELVENDVIVINLFGKVFEGTFAGGNLANSIYAKTGGTGMVIDGGVRDLAQIDQLDLTTYIRGADPTGYRGITLANINTPTRIGRAVCMPGDVVLGTLEGVIFIPPHLAEDVVVDAERTYLRDTFGFEMLHEGKYTPGQIDTRWSEEINKDFIEWLKENKEELSERSPIIDSYIRELEQRLENDED